MADAFEPKPPAQGWALRWTLQASDLMLRAFPILLLGTVVFNLATLPVIFLIGMDGGSRGSLLIGAAAAASIGSIIHLFWTLHVVMKADGHRPEQPLLSGASLRMMAPLLLIDMCTTLISLALMRPSGDAGPSPVGDGSQPYAVLVWLVLYIHANSMVSIVFLIWLTGMLWPPLMVSMGMRLGAYYGRMQRLLASRLGAVYWGMTAIGFVFVFIAPSLPFWLAQLACMYAMTWIYVGAREIFGGISENSPAKAKTPAMRTASTAA